MEIGIFRSAETLRKEIVSFLESHPNSADELFAGLPWMQYLQSMSPDGTYGDHITLQAVANLFGDTACSLFHAWHFSYPDYYPYEWVSNYHVPFRPFCRESIMYV